jgi:P-type E1-E2 ATPase
LGCVFSVIAFIINTTENPLTAPKDDLWLALVLCFVVVFTGFFQYYQENKSGKIMDSFNKMLPQQAIVVREGNKMNIPAEQLVVGDIVHVEIGNKIPADIRVLSCSGL